MIRIGPWPNSACWRAPRLPAPGGGCRELSGPLGAAVDHDQPAYLVLQEMAARLALVYGLLMLFFPPGAAEIGVRFHATRGSMSVGDLVLVNAFLLQLFIPLNFLGIVYSQLKHSIADMQLMFDLLERTPEVQDRPDAVDLQVGSGEVRFDRISRVLFSTDSPGRREQLYDMLSGRGLDLARVADWQEFLLRKPGFAIATAPIDRGLYAGPDAPTLVCEAQLFGARVAQRRRRKRDEPTDSSNIFRDLDELRKSGDFREDLYYRLNVVTLDIPSLSERREDIPLLANHFLRTLNDAEKKGVKGFAPDAMEVLLSAPWPGNVRQLYNVVEQAVAFTTTSLIPASLVQRALRDEAEGEMPAFADARSRFEREYLTQLLQITNGNVSQAARIAKRNRTEFYKLLHKHHLNPSQFKGARAS